MSERTIFAPGNLYGVDHETESLVFHNVQRIRPIRTADNPYFVYPFEAEGAHKHDFALFATVIDNNGATLRDYLMTEVDSSGTGLFVPTKIVDAMPRQYLTLEFAQKAAHLAPEEIDQLGIDSIVRALRSRYPNIR